MNNINIESLINQGKFKQAAVVLANSGNHIEAAKYYALSWEWGLAVEEAKKGGDYFSGLKYAFEGNMPDKENELKELLINNQADKILEAALFYEKKGRIDSAANYYFIGGDAQKAAALLEENRYLIEAAEIREKIKDWTGAGKLYEKIVQIEPENTKARLRLAYILIKYQKYNIAIENLQSILDRQNENREALKWLIYSLEKSGLSQASVEALKKLINLDPQVPAEVINIIKLCNNEIEEDNVDLIANRYQIIRQLGGSDKGRVYLVKDIFLGREVALKLLNFDLLNVSNKNEILSNLHFFQQASNNSLVKIFEIIPQENIYTMEYLQTNLYDYAASGKQIDIRKVVIKVVESFRYLHSKNIIHGNLKPTNIFIDSSGEIKLSDPLPAGMSYSGSTVIEEDFSMGTYYFSPEQITGNQLSIATDFYCLGSLIYFLISGKPPFIKRTKLSQQIPSLKLIFLQLDEAWDILINNLTDPQTDKRLMDYEKIVQTLNILQLNIDTKAKGGKSDNTELTNKEKDNERFKPLHIIEQFNEHMIYLGYDQKLNVEVWIYQAKEQNNFENIKNLASAWANKAFVYLQSIIDIDDNMRQIIFSSPCGVSFKSIKEPLPINISLKILKILYLISNDSDNDKLLPAIVDNIYINLDNCCVTLTFPFNIYYNKKENKYDLLDLWYELRKITPPKYKALPFLIDKEFKKTAGENTIEWLAELDLRNSNQKFLDIVDRVIYYFDEN